MVLKATLPYSASSICTFWNIILNAVILLAAGILLLSEHVFNVAIYTGAIPFTGRLDILSFYKVEGQTRIRVRNPLSRKRVLKSPEFRNTRMHAGWMARASKIGSAVYQALPENFRQFWMYRAFVGEAMTMLKQGMQDENIRFELWKTYAEVWQLKAARVAGAGVKQQEMPQTAMPVPQVAQSTLHSPQKKHNLRDKSAGTAKPRIPSPAIVLSATWKHNRQLFPKIRPAPIFPGEKIEAGQSFRYKKVS